MWVDRLPESVSSGVTSGLAVKGKLILGAAWAVLAQAHDVCWF